MALTKNCMVQSKVETNLQTVAWKLIYKFRNQIMCVQSIYLNKTRFELVQTADPLNPLPLDKTHYKKLISTNETSLVKRNKRFSSCYWK